MSSGKGIDNISRGLTNVSLESSENGAWEEVSRKQKNKAGTSAGRWGQQAQQNPSPRAWGQPDTAHRLGIHGSNAPARNTQSYEQRAQGGFGTRPGKQHTTGPSVTPPLQQGRNWAARTASGVSADKVSDEEEEKANSEEDDEVYTDDDDYLLSDGSDSDDGPETHETRKKHRMLLKFFEILDQLSVQEINEPERQWHCPACHGGPGAIDWYKGLQPLISHARTKGSQRVKLHRTFADVLDEELRRRGTSVVPAGESFGQWEGLKQETKDHDIVWPPMVMVMNTTLEKDDNEKWIGMGNQELLDYFKGYAAARAKHSYGPRGHRGISVLVFDSSAVGYVEAERLHRHFIGQGTGRAAWESNRRVLFYPGGKRQLYGFLAKKDDIDEFNKHCQGKSKLKYEVRSYQEMVMARMKQMSEDNQQLTWFKNKAAKDQRQKKALEESFNIVTEKLRQTTEDYRIVMQRTTKLHEENKEEMDYQEKFFKDQIQTIRDKTDEKEEIFEKLQQDDRKKIEESKTLASNTEDLRRRAEEATKFKELQDQEIGKFVAEREQLIQIHKDKKMEMKKRHWEEELELEKEFDATLTKLMQKYAPHPTEGLDAASGSA